MTARAEAAADRVSITLQPLARIVDPITSLVADERMVNLHVSALTGEQRVVGPLDIDVALAWSRELLGCSHLDAWRKLDRLDRGDAG